MKISIHPSLDVGQLDNPHLDSKVKGGGGGGENDVQENDSYNLHLMLSWGGGGGGVIASEC